MLSLLGILHNACQVVKPGMSFLRRMTELSKVAKRLHHHIQLNTHFWLDLEWWVSLHPQWNGVGLLSNLGQQLHNRAITMDASGLWGCEVYSSEEWWFQIPGGPNGSWSTLPSKNCCQLWWHVQFEETSGLER